MRQQRWLEIIKDFELEVHYHPGKANVVVDVLSRKAHCNYLPVVPLTRKESSIQVLPDLSLYNITLTPILRDEIVSAQRNDEGMGHIKRGMQEGDPKVTCFHDHLGSRVAVCCLLLGATARISRGTLEP
jgi:hypothetical protein